MYKFSHEINKQGGMPHEYPRAYPSAMSPTVSQHDARPSLAVFVPVSKMDPVAKIQPMQIIWHKRIVDSPPLHGYVGVDFLSQTLPTVASSLHTFQGGDAYLT